MAMVKRPEASTVDLKIEATKAVFCGMLEGLKHPYILPVLEVPHSHMCRTCRMCRMTKHHKRQEDRYSADGCKNFRNASDELIFLC